MSSRAANELREDLRVARAMNCPGIRLPRAPRMIEVYGSIPSSTVESRIAAGEPVELEIDLKDPRLAAFLAWLVPGLGHFYQGRTAKGVLFFVCILGTFLYGL